MNLKPVTPPLPSKSRTKSATLLVLHATAGASAGSSVDHLRGKGLSYHFIIARDGRDSAKSASVDGTEPVVFGCVDTGRTAFHVGSTIPAPDGRQINAASIGISLANIQNRKTPEPYPDLQLASLDALVKRLRAEIPTLTHLTTHAAVQPWNRSDAQNIDGADLATRHGLIWWQPDAATVAAHTPKPTKP